MSREPIIPEDDDILDPQDMQVTLELDDGTELECQVLTIFEVDEQDYIALVPVDELEKEEQEVLFYRYYEDEDGEPSLDNIDDDEEFEMVCDIFDQILDDEEFDEM